MRLSEAAKLAGMSEKVLKRILLPLDKELGGMLLVKRYGPVQKAPSMYLITLANLRKVLPDVGKRFATAEDVDEIRGEQKQLRKHLLVLAADVRTVKNDVRELRAKG